MKNTKTYPTGTFLRISLSDGTFAYGRVLEFAYIAFYDYRTSSPSGDLDVIESMPVAFVLTVRMRDAGRWLDIGCRELRGDVGEPVVRFKQSLADPTRCVIYDSVGNERQATPQQCIGLEPPATWDGKHVEERLLDYFSGRPNDMVERLRVRLPPFS